MDSGNIVLLDADYQRLQSVLKNTQSELHAHIVMLIDRAGHQIACEGPDHEIDQTALASLAAANIAATNGLAQLVGEPEFSVLFHQGTQRSIHISDIARGFSLVLVFDQAVASGVVRWKVKRAAFSLDEIMSEVMRRSAPGGPAAAAPAAAPQAQFTDEDINRLVGEINL